MATKRNVKSTAVEGELVDKDTLTIPSVKIMLDDTPLVEMETALAEMPDHTTKEGLETIRQQRRSLIDFRVAIEKARKAGKAPIIAKGKEIDKFAQSIAKRVAVLEDPRDKIIKEIEAEKERIKEEKKRIERERIEGFEKAIAEIMAIPQNLYTLDDIGKANERMAFYSASDFEEFEKSAQMHINATTNIIMTRREAILKEIEEAEAERQRMAEIEAENQRIAAENAEKQRLLDEQIAKQKAEDDARQKKLDEQQAAIKEQQNKLDQEKREATEKEEAERKRAADLKAEQDRIAQEKADREKKAKADKEYIAATAKDREMFIRFDNDLQELCGQFGPTESDTAFNCLQQLQGKIDEIHNIIREF